MEPLHFGGHIDFDDTPRGIEILERKAPYVFGVIATGFSALFGLFLSFVLDAPLSFTYIFIGTVATGSIVMHAYNRVQTNRIYRRTRMTYDDIDSEMAGTIDHDGVAIRRRHEVTRIGWPYFKGHRTFKGKKTIAFYDINDSETFAVADSILDDPARWDELVWLAQEMTPRLKRRLPKKE